MSVASLTGGKDLDGDREVFGAYISDDETAAMLSSIVSEYGWPADRIQSGGIANAVRSLTVMTSPRMLIVDLTESKDPRDDINALAEVCEPGTVVVALGMINDVRLYRDLIASGIQDYLVKPVPQDTFREAIAFAETALYGSPDDADSAEASTHRSVAVIGVRGGVGASMVSSSLSWLMAHEFNRHVALLDLDLHFGTGALTFDLEPGRGLCDALDNPSRVDGLFIERAMIKESDDLCILGAEAPLNDPMSPDPSALGHLHTQLADGFECLVMDIPRHLIGQYPFLMSESTDVLLVTDLTLASTRDTIRILGFLKDVAPKTNVIIVANNVGQPGTDEVSAQDFETSIENTIGWTIPTDQKNMTAAAKRGEALPKTANAAKATTVIRDIAKTVLGVKGATSEATPFWSKLLGKS